MRPLDGFNDILQADGYSGYGKVCVWNPRLICSMRWSPLLRQAHWKIWKHRCDEMWTWKGLPKSVTVRLKVSRSNYWRLRFISHHQCINHTSVGRVDRNTAADEYL
jgi:hypothetical protein